MAVESVAAPTLLSRLRGARLAPTRTELVPWTDRKGRFDTLRATVLALLLVPGLYLAVRWAFGLTGPRGVNAAIHSTGSYAAWMLLASLAISPLRALSGRPQVAVVRRMVGNAALAYVALHLVLYCTDQNWRLWTIGAEIVKRFYLTIGFVAVLGLVALGFTSTDGWMRALGGAWKRLHRIVYGVAVLGLVHYVLQSKLDVSQALLAAGVFYWLMLWRMLPAGADRQVSALLAIGFGAAALTLVSEWAWYRFGTKIDPWRVFWSEFDVSFGLRPAGQVLLLGGVAAGAAELWRLAGTEAGQRPWFAVCVYALGALADDAAALFMGWVSDSDGRQLELDVLWAVSLGALGLARWKLRVAWQRRLLDAVWASCLVYHVALAATDSRSVMTVGAGLVAMAGAVLGAKVWPVSRGAALMLLPMGALLAYEVLGSGS